jgi:hypothetical protein
MVAHGHTAAEKAITCVSKSCPIDSLFLDNKEISFAFSFPEPSSTDSAELVMHSVKLNLAQEPANSTPLPRQVGHWGYLQVYLPVAILGGGIYFMWVRVE